MALLKGAREARGVEQDLWSSDALNTRLPGMLGPAVPTEGPGAKGQLEGRPKFERVCSGLEGNPPGSESLYNLICVSPPNLSAQGPRVYSLLFPLRQSARCSSSSCVVQPFFCR
jgi:hypothetical protein